MNVCPALNELCRKGMTHLMDGERRNTRSLTKPFLQATRLSNRIVGPLPGNTQPSSPDADAVLSEERKPYHIPVHGGVCRF